MDEGLERLRDRFDLGLEGREDGVRADQGPGAAELLQPGCRGAQDGLCCLQRGSGIPDYPG